MGSVNNEEALDVNPGKRKELFVPLFFQKQTIIWPKTPVRLVLSEHIAFLAKKNELSCQKFRISSARTRWGSCSSTGTLSFTWRLVQAPLEGFDYVIVHELVHTQIRNHSPGFWHRLAESMPEYKRYVSWLKKNGRLLSLGEA